MAQIGTVRLETQNSGAVDVPVFETGDSASGIYEFVRVETASGPGFIPVTDPVDATYPYLRVQSQNNGIVAVTDTPGSAIPDSGVARYDFEQDLTDAWNSNDLTGNGGISYTTDAVYGDYASVFDGTDDYASAPFQLDSTQDFSIIGWVYFESFTGDYDPVVAQRDSFSTLDFQFYYDNRDGKQTWNLGVGEELGWNAEFGVSETTGGYRHIALTKGGDNWNFYREDSNDWSATNSQDWSTSDTLQLGTWQSGDIISNLRFDRLEFHDKELTATEVSNHYSTGRISG